MYILQLLAFEHELIKLNSEKQSFYHAVVLAKDKIIKEKEEEIKILSDKLYGRYAKMEKLDQMEMIENQFKKIDEFISSGARRGSLQTKKVKAYNNLLEEMNKYKHLTNDILKSYKNNNQQDLNLYLEKLSHEMPDLER